MDKVDQYIRKTHQNHPIVFFDSACGHCHSVIDWIDRHDKQSRLRFAPLQGRVAESLLGEKERLRLKSIVLVKGGVTYDDSTAFVEVMKLLPPPWSVVACALLLIPRMIRDRLYPLATRLRR